MGLETTPCPQCGALGFLEITERLLAKEIGDFSLSGNQMKFAAQAVPVLRCRMCSLDLVGRYDRAHAVFSPPVPPPEVPGGENAVS